jgi:hypothetical protein
VALGRATQSRSIVRGGREERARIMKGRRRRMNKKEENE